MNIKVIYPGRFQPMGRHHYSSYVHLTRTFGTKNVYIVTSDLVQPPKSPFSFKEKRQIAIEYGVPANHFIVSKEPYKAIELTRTFPADTILIIAVGSKDMDTDPRFSTKKLKSGADSYFQLYTNNKENLRPYTEHGYLYVLPHINIVVPKYGEMSGTVLRKLLKNADVQTFTDIMGWYDRNTFKMIKDKLNNIHENKNTYKYSSWTVPTVAELKKEFKIEHELKGLSYFKDFNHFLNQVKAGKVKRITPEVNRTIAYRSNTESFDELFQLIKTYNSYPKYRNKNTLLDLYSRFKENKSLYLPILLDLGNGRLRCFSGNTRLDIAFQLGIVPKALVVSITSDINELIVEGGASGHLAHIHDNLELTFDDLYEIVNRALSGKLNIEKEVQEKTDGQALHITYKDGKIKAARNKSQILNPIDSDEIKLKFSGRGDIEKAFGYAMDDLETALKSLSEKTLNEIFQNGSRFINLEIIYPATKNVINYGAPAYLQFHGLLEYDQNGNKIDTFPEFGTKLYNLINKVNASVQRTFKIIPPNIIQLKQATNLDDRIAYYNSRIATLQRQYNLNGSDTIYMWHLGFWTQFLEKYVPNIDTEIIPHLVKRWVYNIKSFKLNTMNIPNHEVLDTLKDLENTVVPRQVQKNISLFEDIFLALGVEILKSITAVLSLNPKQTSDEIRASLLQTINQIKNSGDIKALDKVKDQLNRLKSIGGLNSIVPIEGIVFMYKGKTYKLTGAFAPINAILGILKFEN